VPATAISGTMIGFQFTVTSYTGTKYFKLELPRDTTYGYGITYYNASDIPTNNFNL